MRTTEERTAAQERYLAFKREILWHYSRGRCVCCGEDRITTLTIDHVHNDGAQERRETKTRGGLSFYRMLKARGYPPGYQVLCFSCNVSKHLNGGRCEHQDTIDFTKGVPSPDWWALFHEEEGNFD